MDKQTPMLKQYKQIKAKYKDYILFFRLGDFYEMFFEDAKTASRILDVVLTSRNAGKNTRIPMCGIPYHSADSYISKLIKNGLKVAICEQVEDPKKAKGIVRREVIRTITPGTFIDEDPSQQPLLAAVSGEREISLSVLDITSGSVKVAQMQASELIDYLLIAKVKEGLYPESNSYLKEILSHPLIKAKAITITPYFDWAFSEEFAKDELPKGVGLSYLSRLGVGRQVIGSVGAVMRYAREMAHASLEHVRNIGLIQPRDAMYIQPAAFSGLGIEELISVIDRTKTAMGRRRLREMFFAPLIDVDRIKQRQRVVRLLLENIDTAYALSQRLRQIGDIERSLSRISCGYQRARDIISLRNGLVLLRAIRDEFGELLSQNEMLSIDVPDELATLLERAVVDSLPQRIEGNLIRHGYSSEIDRLRNIKEKGDDYLKELQEREIRETGIQSLKVKYNKVFGYYIEVTKANTHLVPDRYIRKQTLVNAERYITEELKQFEEEILTAEQRLIEEEARIISELCERIIADASAVLRLAQQVGSIDAFLALAVSAKELNYTCPVVTEEIDIEIRDGRHPIVELTTDDFIPNDISITKEKNFFVITGPNMAGKSTFIRQVGLIVLMAQAGSFVPASYASIGIVDRLFSRIGSHDEIFKGQSTFMVEMSQTAAILSSASRRSLVILDEVGRGTSTYDGMSIAWAVSEYLASKGVRTLFATHFHELTSLENELPNVKNLSVAVKEWGEDVVFLHKIIDGGSDQSYGIYVAKIAGLPRKVLERAREILSKLEQRSPDMELAGKKDMSGERQLPLFYDPAVALYNELKWLDLDNISPRDALNILYEWKKKTG